MYKIIIILILCIKLIAQENKQNIDIDIWNQIEKPSMENNYQYGKKIYYTKDKSDAIIVILIESLFKMDKILEKKKLQTDFKYLKDFD